MTTHLAYLVITWLAAAANLAAAAVDFARTRWILDGLTKLGVPRSWLFPLGAAKVAGAAGLLVGIAIPAIGTAAAAALVVYFAGAVFAVLRVRWFVNVPAPASYLVLAIAAFALRVAAY